MGGGKHLLPGGVRPGGPDIFQQALLEQPGVLEHKGHPFHEGGAVQFPHVRAAHGDSAAVHIPESGNEARRGGLASAGGPHQGDHLTGPDRKTHILQRGPAGAGVGEGHMVKGYGVAGRLLLSLRLLHGLLAQDLIQPADCLIGLHHRLAHIHDAVDHLAAGGGEQGVEDKIHQRRAHISAGGDQQHRRDQQRKGPVDKGEEAGLAGSAAHGVLAGQVAVILNGSVEGLEGVDRLLEHLYHRNAPDILHRLAAHALDLLLIAVEEAGIFAAHHQAHGQQSQHHGEQAQKAHPPVKEEQHDDGSDGCHRRGGQVGELVGQQVLGEPGVVVDELAQPPRLIPGKKAQGELQHMGHSGAPDVPGGAEGRDMGGHKGGKVQQDTANGKPHRHPAKTTQIPGPVQAGPGGQYASGHQPDTQVGCQPQHRRQGGQDTAQDRQVFVPARIAQDASQAAWFLLFQSDPSLSK